MNGDPKYWPYNVRTREEQQAWREGFQAGYDAASCERRTEKISIPRLVIAVFGVAFVLYLFYWF